jgi:hypothetical protein
MTWYYAENSQKYGVNEILNFVNKEKGVLLKIDINWKWARFYINHEGEIEVFPSLTEMYSSFDEVVTDWMESGTEIFTFYDLNTNEVIEDVDEFNHIIDGYWDEGINCLDDNGYIEEDPELWIIGGFTLETTEPPFEV